MLWPNKTEDKIEDGESVADVTWTSSYLKTPILCFEIQGRSSVRGRSSQKEFRVLNKFILRHRQRQPVKITQNSHKTWK